MVRNTGAEFVLRREFGNRSFRVNDMTSSVADELGGTLGIQDDNPLALRTKIGKWLSSQGDSIVVLEAADQSKPGLYRLGNP